MVKSVLGVSTLGLRDWFIQRVTAIFMTLYSIGLFVYFLRHPDLAFYEWHGLFNSLWMKVTTLVFILCLLAHAWVGMWTVFTDYVKPFCIRLVLYTVVLLGLIAFFLEALMILWGV